jgi:phosphate:Na+ symporter
VIIAILFLFTMRKKWQSIGVVLLGISFVFMAMGGFESLAEPLREFGVIDRLLHTLNESYLIAVITGAIITGIIQSSTATTGIIMGFLTGGAIELDSAIAVILGSNIGTCVDALLAAIGGGKEAKLTAYAHIWLNVLGVAAFYPFISELSDIGMRLANSADVQLAHISVLFNVICSLVLLPFANLFGRFILKVHG